jgi:hypothetical protein
MLTEFDYATLTSAGAWTGLRADLDPKAGSRILPQILDTFRKCGAVQYIEETAYLDRDFSAAYSSFYSTLYRLRTKLCRRVHFFSADVSRHLGRDVAKIDTAKGLEGDAKHYLGNIVIRPLPHSPLGSAIVSTDHFETLGTTISVRSDFKVHLLGAELTIRGTPVTEQDKRTGACAQATIWAAGRHLHNKHAMPWFSITDITEAALSLTDSLLARSLPAGSEYLTDDTMVRALRAMGAHPITYSVDEKDENPRRTIARYIDSGIPVIVGLGRGTGIGHAVVVVGSVASKTHPVTKNKQPAAMGDRVKNFLVNDDQRGIYLALPAGRPSTVRAASGSDDIEDADGTYSLDEAKFLIVPLPNKVFIRARIAETLARDKISSLTAQRAEHVKNAYPELPFENWKGDPEFYATDTFDLVARTYLTHGWKYKQRLMRNMVAEELKDEVTGIQLPRYVWVTEFSLPKDVADPDPCKRLVRAHVVIDATGGTSEHEDAVIISHLPGIIVANPSDPFTETKLRTRVLLADNAYFPKVRGERGFDMCATAPAADVGLPPTA